MKVCRITKDILPLYERYLPSRYRSMIDNKNYHIFGIYERKEVRGAAVIQIVDGIAEILSLLYDEDIIYGVCERRITSMILKMAAAYDVSRIRYIAEGSEEELRELDYEMYDIGYAAREGEVKLYKTTLGELLQTSKKYIELVEKRLDKQPIVSGEQLTKLQIKAYNDEHSNIPYSDELLDPRITLFWIKDGMPNACVMARQNEDGDIVFVWMTYEKNVSRETLIFMFYAQMIYAKKYYSPDVSVSVCPFSEEVEILVSQLGFREVIDEKAKTHIYTMYLG